MSTQRLAILSLTGAGERECCDCVYLDRSHCDAMGAPMPVSAVPWRLPECIQAERDAARLRNVEAAAAVVLTDIEAALSEAENIASGRKGMQVPYHGPFAATLHLPSTVRDLREMARALRAALKP